jgi:hypothetical protein
MSRFFSRNLPRGFDLISDALPFGGLWYGEPNAVSNAIGFAKHRSRSHDAVIRVYDEAGNVIETHEHKGNPPKRSSGKGEAANATASSYSAKCRARLGSSL